MPRNNQYLVGAQAQAAMERFKLECAMEIGITNYSNIDKGELPSRVNGSVGGEMVKRMIAIAEQTIAGTTGGFTQQTSVQQMGLSH